MKHMLWDYFGQMVLVVFIIGNILIKIRIDLKHIHLIEQVIIGQFQILI
jgi:hypothetical protein